MTDYYESLQFGETALSSDVDYALRESSGVKKPDLIDTTGAALSEAVSPFAIERIYDRRSSQFKADKEWSIDESTQKDLDQNYNNKETGYLKGANSEQEFVARKRYINEDRERRSIIGQSGAVGVAATVAFSLLDPISIGAAAISGPVGWGGKATGVARALKIGAMSGIENSIIEGVLMEGNTQSSGTDVIMAFGAGAVIGGSLGMLSKATPPSPKLIQQASAADRAVADDADKLVSKKILDEARTKVDTSIEKEFPDVDLGEVRGKFDEYEKSLTRETKGGMPKNIRKQTEGKIKELEDNMSIEDLEVSKAQGEVKLTREQIMIDEAYYIAKIEPARAEVTSKYSTLIAEQEAKIKKIEANLAVDKGSKKQAAKLYKAETALEDLKAKLKKDLADVETNLKSKVDSTRKKFEDDLNLKTKDSKMRRAYTTNAVKKAKTRLDIADRAKQARIDLRRWTAMTDAEKIKHLYKDGKPPLKAETLKRQLDAIPDDEPKVDTDIKPMSAAPEESTVKAPGDNTGGSVGAAGIGEKPVQKVFDVPWSKKMAINRFTVDGSNVGTALRGKRILPPFLRALESLHTKLSNSGNMSIRGLAYHLFEAPQGGKAAAVTAASRVKVYTQRIRSAMANRLNEGLEEWGKGQGLSVMATLLKQKNYSSYHKKVMIEVRYPGTFTDDAIVKGAAGVKAQFREAGIINRDAGVGGFENLDVEANYVPTILNETLIKNACVDNFHGVEKVKALISEGYQKGKFKLQPKTADQIADAYVKRALDHSLSMRDAVRTVTGTDVDDLAKNLKTAGVDDDTIQSFLDDTMSKEVRQHMSDRAKKSLEPDIRAELNGLKMIDLVDSDLPKLLESYTRDAAGGAAMAKLGFKTRAQFFDFLNDVQKQSDNLGVNSTDTARDMQILRDGVDLLYGRSINPDAHSALVRNISRFRDLTSFLRLQSVGISSIPEIARITTKRGLSTVLDNISDLGIGISGTKKLRKGGKYSGKFKRPDLEEQERMLGYIGEDHVLYPNGLRVDNLEESGFYNSLGQKVDNMLAQGKRVQEILSAFRMVQGGGEKIAVRSLGSQIKKWVDGAGSALSKSDIEDAGWSDGFLDKAKEWMIANPATDTFNGVEFRLFNFDKMPADMQERLQIGMHRLIARDMQRPMIGETPIFMHKWLGQTMTQFRSFSLLSLEKQLVHDIRHDRIAGSIIAMQSAFLGYTSLTISAMLSGLGRDDQDEYIKNQLTGNNAILGTINRMGQLASAGIALDFMAGLGALPDDMMAAPGQTGYRGLTPSSVPVIGMGGDFMDIGKDIVSALKGDIDSDKTLKDLQNVIPFAKAIGINQAFNAIAR